jgi:hypothetical protein
MAASLTLQITSVDLMHPLGYAGKADFPSGLPSLTPIADIRRSVQHGSGLLANGPFLQPVRTRSRRAILPF